MQNTMVGGGLGWLFGEKRIKMKVRENNVKGKGENCIKTE